MYFQEKVSAIIKSTCVLSLLILPLSLFGVTQKEMEQARTIAAKAYIRYVNDGSGYLDDIHPTTIEELQKSLKPKEKENIKAFLAISVPNDYQGWDKQKLLDYWAKDVFQSKGLVEKGRGGRILARKEINKMNIAAPTAPAKEVTKPTPQQSSTTQAPGSTGTATPKETPAETTSPTETPSAAITADSLLNATDTLSSQLFADDDEYEFPEEPNYTWVYIMILAILVAIVIALVVYAANVLKKNGNNQSVSVVSHEEDMEKIKQYEAALTDKDFEISMLTKKLENANKQNSELKSKLEALTSEIAALRAAPVTSLQKEADNISGISRQNKPAPLRTIYLGRANSKQIFVRADRTLNIGNSVFVLDTSDGVTGSFRVADSPAAWSLALSNPEEYLSHACTGHNLDDTTGVNRIINEASGTAIFEGGCWRVIRKAKIRYE